MFKRKSRSAISNFSSHQPRFGQGFDSKKSKMVAKIKVKWWDTSSNHAHTMQLHSDNGKSMHDCCSTRLKDRVWFLSPVYADCAQLPCHYTRVIMSEANQKLKEVYFIKKYSKT